MFGKKKPAPRKCAEGHELEESWEQCPFCEVDRREETSRRAVVVSKPVVGPRRLAGWIVALGGEQDGEDFRLRTGRNVLGKGEKCDVVLKDSQVSERHVVLEYRVSDDRWTIQDLESKHGTSLNGKRIEGDGRPMKDGDRLRVGKTELYFRSLPSGAVAGDA